jgi:hypothetical protein
MSITAISSSSTFLTGESNQMAQTKQNFEDLSSALRSGDLDAARKAFALLQKSAPAQSDDDKNSMSSTMAALGTALNSGDLKGAQEAYSKIQQKLSQSREANATNSGRSSKSGAGKEKSSDSSAVVYDKMDTNKDGTVSALERLSYELKHPLDSTSITSSEKQSDTSSNRIGIETYA